MTSATLEGVAGLFQRYEAEIAALDQRQKAAAQTLHATEATQAEMSTRVAELLVELKTAEGKAAEAEMRARQILADAERRAFGTVNSANKDAEASREKFRVAIAAAQAAFARLG
jgi:chromosome segregation ATPase